MATVNAINTYIVPTTANEVTMPAQPAFYSYLGTNDGNATGDGTSYTLGSGNALTEVFDQNNDITTVGVFTAPVTGRYALFSGIKLYTVGAATDEICKFITSNRNYVFIQWNPSAVPNSSDYSSNHGEVIADMDAADTCTINVVVSGTTQTVGILATSSNTVFQGVLIC